MLPHHLPILLFACVLAVQTTILVFPNLQNCQNIQQNSYTATCIECYSGYKLVNQICQKCLYGDTNRQCINQKTFHYGNSQSKETSEKVSYRIVNQVQNKEYILGSSRQILSTDALEVANNSQIQQKDGTNQQNFDYNQTLNLTIQQNQAVETNTSHNQQIDKIVYVEYKKDFKPQKLNQNAIQTNKLDLKINQQSLTLNFIQVKPEKHFILNQQYLSSPTIQKIRQNRGQTCIQWSQTQDQDSDQEKKQCINCKQGYILSLSDRECTKVASGLQILEINFNPDPHCLIFNYSIEQSQNYCSKCKYDYIYSIQDKKCQAKDPFCKIYEEGVCIQCIEKFNFDNNRSKCLFKFN